MATFRRFLTIPKTTSSTAQQPLSTSRHITSGGHKIPLAMKAESLFTSKWPSYWIYLTAKAKETWPKGLNIQAFVEKVILDCRFFALPGIVGSLISSLLCFVEGCLLIMQSYTQMSGHFLPLIIEATDMFLLGTAMLTFAKALHFMFMGQRAASSQHKFQRLSPAMQAKLKIGHAVIMILQVQVLEKLKSVAVTNSLDLALLAGAVFLSSMSLFVLSETTVSHRQICPTSDIDGK